MSESDARTNEPDAAGRLPDFLIIGCMKGGSTTLWKHLDRHPNVFLCRPKEPQFFSRPEAFAKGWDWYRGLFANAASDQLCGEASVCYTRYPTFPDAAVNVAAHLPDAKLVFIARDPVQRAISHYIHNMLLATDAGKPHIGFEEAAQEDPSLLASGEYVDQLERYLQHYNRESLFCTTLEGLVADQVGVLKSLAVFLGVSGAPYNTEVPIVANKQGGLAVHRQFKRYKKSLRASPARHAFKVIPKPLRAKIDLWIRKSAFNAWIVNRRDQQYKQKLTEIGEQVRPFLNDYYREHNQRFRSFIGIEQLGWYDDPAPAPAPPPSPAADTVSPVNT